MEEREGQKRVVIENIRPQVNGGTFPVKRVLGEPLKVQADIFADGHDEVRASLFYRHNEGKWHEMPMTLKGNDLWECDLPVDKQGTYEFKVQAWIDHFGTWKYNLKKKADAGQDVAVELQIGASMVEDAAKYGNKSQVKKLNKWARQLREDASQSTLLLALSNEVQEVVDQTTQKDLATMHPVTFQVDVERPKALFSTWYELFPRSAAPEEGRHGTFKDVERLVPHISEMGFDVLYMPPVHPIGEMKRKGKNNATTAEKGDPGSPWAIGSKHGGHKALHPELGTIKDFQSLVKTAGQHDIEIAMDIAFQCAPDHPWVKEHPQWFKWRPDGTVQYAENPPKKYEDILPINFETEDWQNLWQELKSVVDYWIGKGVKIFRVDNPHTKAFPFWEWMIREVRKKHPEVIFLAEAFTRPRLMERLAKIGFNQSYTYFTWRNSKHELEAYMEELTNSNLRNYFRPNFWPNTPDLLPPVLTYGGEPAFLMRYILAGTLSSSCGVYGPVYEYGYRTPHPKKEEYIDSEKYEIKHWDFFQNTRIKEVMTLINRLRQEHPALQSTFNYIPVKTSSDHLFAFAKMDEVSGDRLLIVVNTDPYSPHEGYIRLPLYDLKLAYGQTISVYDHLSGDVYYWYQEWNFVRLDPEKMPAHALEVKRA